MKKTLTALALLIGATFGSAASAATLNFKYNFTPEVTMQLSLTGSQTGSIFTIDGVLARIQSIGGALGISSFTFDSALGTYALTGNNDSDRASYNIATRTFDLAMIELPLDNACPDGAGFCLLGTYASVTTANGRFLPTTFSTANLTQIAAVPLPASLPLLAGGIGLFGLMAKRRKQKAA